MTIENSGLTGRRRWGPADVLAIVLAIFALAQTWNRAEKMFGYDFYQFWLVGRELGKPGAENVYSDRFREQAGERYWQIAHASGVPTAQVIASDRRRVLETYSTPLLYSFFALIGTRSYAHSLLIYECVNFIVGIAAIGILGRILGYSLAATVMLVAVLFGWGEAYLSEVFCSNVNQLEIFAISLLLLFELRRGGARRDILCGAWLACIVLFKPNIAAVAGCLGLMWLVDREFARLFRHAIAFMIAAILLAIWTVIRFHTARCWGQWLGAIGEIRSVVQHEKNYSLAAVALSHWGHAAALVIEWILPAFVAVSILLTRGRKRLFLVVALSAAMALVSSPICWLHYHILGVPLLMYILRPGQADESSSWRFIRNAIAGLSLVMICTSPVVTEWFWLGDPDSLAQRMAGAATALLALGLIELYRISKAAARADQPGAVT